MQTQFYGVQVLHLWQHLEGLRRVSIATCNTTTKDCVKYLVKRKHEKQMQWYPLQSLRVAQSSFPWHDGGKKYAKTFKFILQNYRLYMDLWSPSPNCGWFSCCLTPSWTASVVFVGHYGVEEVPQSAVCAWQALQERGCETMNIGVHRTYRLLLLILAEICSHLCPDLFKFLKLLIKPANQQQQKPVSLRCDHLAMTRL